jgi:amino-acid N-acetyltransferase
MTNWTFRPAVSTDWAAIAALLGGAALPLEGAEDHLSDFLLAFQAEKLVGTAALERYDTTGLLRSVVVAEAEQGSGLGKELVRRLLDQARADGLANVVLLTTTAAGFFPRFGFRPIRRDETPLAAQHSLEFQEACPASATVMLLALLPAPTGGAA